MTKPVRLLFAALVPAMLGLGLASVDAAAEQKIRVALGDIESVETLNLMIAFEHAKERGVDVELISFKSEDIANQAVVNDQADIGIGTPYAVIQNVNAPIRIFYQLATLQFFPVVNKEFYDSWQDLNGEEMVVHSRTSGTLALANLMALKEGIEYGNISYVPGSEVRALSMLNGTIKATYLDVVNTNFLMKEAPGKFKILPREEASASDEALFASQKFLDGNPEVVDVLLEELLKVWREAGKDPQYILSERERLGLLPDLPADLEPEVLPFYESAAESGMHPPNGGGADAASADLEFYMVAGQLKGPLEDLKVEDYWDLTPLQRALEKLGEV
ncbi:MAG: ABC transporter substrate-binding protein [Alphaproteobacteria bacterium]